VTVGWNQRPCLELLLKSYVQHHWIGNPLKLLLFDNGSEDGSKEWLMSNDIPFINSNENIGHENAINKIYNQIKTKYVLLVDSDVQFKEYVFDYIDHMDNIIVSAGELIDKNFINDVKIKDRISPWFTLFNYQRVKEAGIKTFRTNEDWTYDVGSEFYERITEAGFQNFNIERLPGNQDDDLISMKYEKFYHIGKTSWDIFNKHQDRIDEVLKRRWYIQDQLQNYQHIDLKGKFIYGT
jgi:glycosyltransferase involved in cell wall biosynthesis